MRDAVSLIGKTLSIKEINYVIDGMYFVPGANVLYLKLKKPDMVSINYSYNDLLPYLIEQMKI